MLNKVNKPQLNTLLKHETKKHSLLRFLGLIVIVVLYFVYISAKLGTGTGLYVTLLTWTFFIFCTPIADAGFLLAFPIRLLVGIRMMYTQIFAFFLAFFINWYALIHTPHVYSSTIILNLFHKILIEPYPLWGIILLSLVGTILSIYFADELIDVSSHSERKKYSKHINKYKIIVFIFLIAFTIILYNFLLKQLGVHIPL